MKDNDTRIYLAARAAGFPKKAAELVVCQARHETGNYLSHVFKNNNNAFGMRPAQARETTRLAEPPDGKTENGYAYYASIEDSVKDLALWFSARRVSKDIRSVEDYATALKAKGYYEAGLSEYMSGMHRAETNLEINTEA